MKKVKTGAGIRKFAKYVCENGSVQKAKYCLCEYLFDYSRKTYQYIYERACS